MRRLVYYNSSRASISPDFIIRVKTDNAGVSANNQYTIDFRNVNNVFVDWGDGSAVQNVITSGADNLITHTYPVVGEYEIKISGVDVAILNQSGFTDVLKILEIKNYGTIRMRSWDRFMQSCSNLIVTALPPTYNIGATGAGTVFGGFRAFSGASLVNVNFAEYVLLSQDRRNIFANSGMSTANYTDTIVGWANQHFNGTNTPNSVDMSGQTGRTFDTSRSGGANFANAGTARTYLTSTGLWTISGDTVI